LHRLQIHRHIAICVGERSIPPRSRRIWLLLLLLLLLLLIHVPRRRLLSLLLLLLISVATTLPTIRSITNSPITLNKPRGPLLLLL